MVGGRAKDLISSARRWTSASVGSLGFSGSRAEAADPEPASYQYTRLLPPSSCGSWRRPHKISVEPRQRERKVKRWEGQRPRCPCNDESGSGDAAPPGVATNRAARTLPLPVWRRIGQRGRCPSRCGDKTPHGQNRTFRAGFLLRHGHNKNSGATGKTDSHKNSRMPPFSMTRTR